MFIQYLQDIYGNKNEFTFSFICLILHVVNHISYGPNLIVMRKCLSNGKACVSPEMCKNFAYSLYVCLVDHFHTYLQIFLWSFFIEHLNEIITRVI